MRAVAALTLSRRAISDVVLGVHQLHTLQH